MSKSAKSARSAKRKKEKAGRKNANTARYASLRDAGINQKSKRFSLKAKRAKLVRVNRVKKPAPTSIARQAELFHIEQAIAKAKSVKAKERIAAINARKAKSNAKLEKHLAVMDAAKARAML